MLGPGLVARCGQGQGHAVGGQGLGLAGGYRSPARVPLSPPQDDPSKVSHLQALAAGLPEGTLSFYNGELSTPGAGR